MRLWSVHPSILDRRGLVACWREALLAQKVLQGFTKGYRHHPQLHRFAQQQDSVAAICRYLHGIADEADRRSYRFNRSRVVMGRDEAVVPVIPVTRGQLDYEFDFLKQKVQQRDHAWFLSLDTVDPGFFEQGTVRCHPSFVPVDGPIEPWEKI
ncbi:pyrimidine dimer DNA glycosylase/endonuclease V [Corynebacterium mastitidis]|uniref:pyrimidine dimer DNA glycosylase/endonuclease V n=1 Tax=Corynebacterium mastitidis TaxID=161890 RepID=UPI00254E965E|nr:pyrimidine dimer DNA glycosylase/endonuclease V [Corynebacterium mastitidis]MDK8451446.1 pyrimidine dimer DNA glycosylase/endonuclease V [Corynebacterium mastitidis]